jgi:flagellin-like protein
MNVPRRKAVSPIISTLLLIAIAVAAGIIVYVFVGGLGSSLTKSGGSQVTELWSLDAYNYVLGTAANSCGTQTAPCLQVYFRNTGSAPSTIGSVFFDGVTVPIADVANIGGTTNCINTGGYSSDAAVAVSGTCSFAIITLSSMASATAGTSHTVKLITATGSSTSVTVTAGSSG